jgi:hypothetical protein
MRFAVLPMACIIVVAIIGLRSARACRRHACGRNETDPVLARAANITPAVCTAEWGSRVRRGDEQISGGGRRRFSTRRADGRGDHVAAPSDWNDATFGWHRAERYQEASGKRQDFNEIMIRASRRTEPSKSRRFYPASNMRCFVPPGPINARTLAAHRGQRPSKAVSSRLRYSRP